MTCATLVLLASTAAGWQAVGDAATAPPAVSVTVGLRQRNLAWLKAEHDKRTDPANKLYREFLEIETVKAMVYPREGEVKDVVAWLEQRGLSVAKNLGDALRVQGSVKDVAAAFHTPMTAYRHPTKQVTIWRAANPSAGIDFTKLHPLIDSVYSLTDFPSFKVGSHAPDAKPASIAPQTVYQQYNYTSAGSSLGNVSVAQLSYCDVSIKDTNEFCKESRLNCTLDEKHVTGPTKDLGCGEADMDIQLVYTTAPEVAAYVDGGYSDFLVWTTTWFNNKDGVLVSSLSYGADETRRQNTDRTNNEFMKLASIGRTVFVAAGDAGADGSEGDTCSPKFVPSWPATSPYITTVGSTESTPGSAGPLVNPPPLCSSKVGPCVGAGVERAVSVGLSGYTSGGGFSIVYPRQSWQAAAVEGYLSSGVKLPQESRWNRSGRAYPDVAAFGGQNLVITGGKVQSSGGTSAASPLWAGVFASMNSIALKKSGKPLGPGAPFLYKLHSERPECFTDITVGDNICPTRGIRDCNACEGFITAKGWDPVTGLGTPNIKCLLQYVSDM